MAMVKVGAVTWAASRRYGRAVTRQPDAYACLDYEGMRHHPERGGNGPLNMGSP